MSRPRTFSVAVATCAAASLADPGGPAGPSGPSGPPAHELASVDAIIRLARQAALDARVAAPTSSRRTRRSLLRAVRRLAYAHAITGRLLTDHEPPGARAAAIFSHGASEVAGCSAALARSADGRQQATALRVLRHVSRMQDDVTSTATVAQSSGSISDLIAAFSSIAVDQHALLDALATAADCPGLPPRTRARLQASASHARRTQDEMLAALARARAAVVDVEDGAGTVPRSLQAGPAAARPVSVSRGRSARGSR